MSSDNFEVVFVGVCVCWLLIMKVLGIIFNSTDIKCTDYIINHKGCAENPAQPCSLIKCNVEIILRYILLRQLI